MWVIENFEFVVLGFDIGVGKWWDYDGDSGDCIDGFWLLFGFCVIGWVYWMLVVLMVIGLVGC